MVTTNSINNTVGSSDSGLTNTLTVQNTSNTASSQATILTTVGGGTAGDTWHQWSVGSTRSFSIGVDNSDTNDSLKFTTAASGSIDPSSGTFLGAINPSTGGLEWGPDANGGGTTAVIALFKKNQSAATSLSVQNASDTSGAQAQLSVLNTVATGSNTGAFVAANTAGGDARFRGRVELQTSEVSDGLNISSLNTAGTATTRFYTGASASAVLSGTITPTGGWEIGIDAAGTSSASKIVSVAKNYDGSTTLGVSNTNSGSSAFAGFIASNDATFATITVPSSGNSTTAIRNKLFINSSDASNDGIVYNTRGGGTHAFYANVAGAGLIMTADSTGLTMATPLTIGTHQIFTTRQTTPSAGTIGEQIRSQVGSGAAVSVSSGSGTNFTSINLTAGVWDVSSVCMLNGTITGTVVQHGITTSSTGAGAVVGDNRVDGSWLPNAATDVYYAIPSYRVVVTTTTTYYANIAATYTVGSLKAYGRLSATRVA